MGVISALGDSAASLHSALCNGQASSYSLDDPGRNCAHGRRSGRISAFQPEGRLEGRNLRPLDRTGQLVVAATKLAFEGSGWEPEDVVEHEVGVLVGGKVRRV